MRLLFVSPSYYPHVGGVEYVVKSVAERLTRRGHEVTVLCGESSIEKPREELINGIRVMRWPVWNRGNAYHIPRMRSSLEEWLLESVKSYDIVHFHSVHSIFTVYSLDIVNRLSVRRVVTPYYHGTGHTLVRRFLWRLWRLYVRRLLSKSDIVHVVSKYEAELVERDFRVKAVPIENGVEEWLCDIEWRPEGYVMYSGRIEKYKNIDRLASIVKILNTRYGLELKLNIYGSGSYLSKLCKHLDKIRVEYSINPFQEFEKYIVTLSRASLFGLLSEKESYPQSVNEANAIGVPVVVVEPWGYNFQSRSRTLITSLKKNNEVIADEVIAFLGESVKQQKSDVPSWSEVVDRYTRILYEERY